MTYLAIMRCRRQDTYAFVMSDRYIMALYTYCLFARKVVELQSKSQLKALYKDNASTIEGNCDTTLFLGGKEKDTLKDLAEILGKETIDLYNTSDTRGTSQSYGLNYQKTGKDMPYLLMKSSVALNFT